MKYVFFGTPRFAEIILKQLIEAGMPPVALVCNPDRPVGRKKVITPPPTKILAAESSAGITVLQPEALDEDFIKTIKGLSADLAVVAAYAKIIPDAILKIPRLGTIGVHPSLLPKYRGASPIQSVILGGEEETGITLYQMDAKMDHGPILAQDTWPIADNEQYLQLEEELAHLAAALLIKTLPALMEGTITAVPQDESQKTLTRKFTAEDGFIKPLDIKAAEQGDAERAELILRAVNALTPEPGAWTTINEKRIKLLAGHAERGALKITKIQREGETPKDISTTSLFS